MASPKQKLGRGVLGAPSWERHSDRNGTIHLTPTSRHFGNGEGTVIFNQALNGKIGELIVRVIDDRNKPNPKARIKLSPSKWKAADGAEVVIGHGQLFTETMSVDRRPRLIGVQPLDGRSEDWLDTMSVWHSEVELFFREGGGGR